MARIPHGTGNPLIPSPSRWLAALDVADTVDDIVTVTREFVEACSPRELLRLPSHCRPGRIQDAGQLRHLARLLARARAEFSGRLVDALVLDRVAGFFDEAMHRIALIAPTGMAAGGALRNMS